MSASIHSIEHAAQGTLEGHIWPLVPNGEYTACYIEHETRFYCNTARLFVHFKILDYGEHFEKVLYRAYRLKSIKSPKRRKSAFKYSRGSDYAHELCKAAGHRIDRVDRISPTVLNGLILRVRVEVVTQDYRQRKHPELLRYSVVREVIGIAEGI